MMSDSADTDQFCAVWSGFALFVQICLSKHLV